jgi:hypothetical protein
MKKILFALLIIFALNEYTSSQFLKGYGFEGGLLYHSQCSINYGSNLSFDQWGGAFGIDLGILGEFSLYKKLSLMGGLHLSDKGTSTSDPGISTPIIFGSNSRPISNRYRYLTLQLSFKYNFKKPGYGYYVLCGLRTDMMLQNYYTGKYWDHISLPNGGFEAGGSFGLGYDFPSGFLIEFQYNPNIPKIYHLTVENYNWDVKIYRSSFILYLGYIFRGEGK